MGRPACLMDLVRQRWAEGHTLFVAETLGAVPTLGAGWVTEELQRHEVCGRTPTERRTGG